MLQEGQSLGTLTGDGTEEHHSLDQLAKGLASGTLSRRRALELGGAAILGGLLGMVGLGMRPEEAQARRRRPRCLACAGPGSCASSSCGTVPSGSNATFCSCVETTSGKKCCVAAECGGQPCDSNSDCGRGQVCSTTAKGCLSGGQPCSTSRKPGICVKRCNKPASTAASQSTSSSSERSSASAWTR